MTPTPMETQPEDTQESLDGDAPNGVHRLWCTRTHIQAPAYRWQVSQVVKQC